MRPKRVRPGTISAPARARPETDRASQVEAAASGPAALRAALAVRQAEAAAATASERADDPRARAGRTAAVRSVSPRFVWGRGRAPAFSTTARRTDRRG